MSTFVPSRQLVLHAVVKNIDIQTGHFVKSLTFRNSLNAAAHNVVRVPCDRHGGRGYDHKFVLSCSYIGACIDRSDNYSLS